MKLYTRNDIAKATNKSEFSVRYWLKINKIQPTKVIQNNLKTNIFLYSEDIYYKAVYLIAFKPKRYNRVILNKKISDTIYLDKQLNLVIQSKLNFLTLEQL